MTFRHLRAPAPFCILLGIALGVAACVPPPPAFIGPPPNPYPPVPPPLTEARPLPPVSEEQQIWRIGEWEWVGTTYVWQPGEWEKLDGHSRQFLPGHWIVQGTLWTWERGHWL